MSNITIVGGGLVGSLLAIFLAKRGHQVSVFERRPNLRRTDVYAGRSINLVVSHRGWTALRAAGVEEAVKQIRPCPCTPARRTTAMASSIAFRTASTTARSIP